MAAASPQVVPVSASRANPEQAMDTKLATKEAIAVSVKFPTGQVLRGILSGDQASSPKGLRLVLEQNLKTSFFRMVDPALFFYNGRELDDSRSLASQISVDGIGALELQCVQAPLFGLPDRCAGLHCEGNLPFLRFGAGALVSLFSHLSRAGWVDGDGKEEKNDSVHIFADLPVVLHSATPDNKLVVSDGVILAACEFRQPVANLVLTGGAIGSRITLSGALRQLRAQELRPFKFQPLAIVIDSFERQEQLGSPFPEVFVPDCVARQMKRTLEPRALKKAASTMGSAEILFPPGLLESNAADWPCFFPPEVWLHVFSFLSPSDLMSCAGVCRLFSEAAVVDQLWAPLVLRDFAGIISSGIVNARERVLEGYDFPDDAGPTAPEDVVGKAARLFQKIAAVADPIHHPAADSGEALMQSMEDTFVCHCPPPALSQGPPQLVRIDWRSFAASYWRLRRLVTRGAELSHTCLSCMKQHLIGTCPMCASLMDQVPSVDLKEGRWREVCGVSIESCPKCGIFLESEWCQHCGVTRLSESVSRCPAGNHCKNKQFCTGCALDCLRCESAFCQDCVGFDTLGLCHDCYSGFAQAAGKEMRGADPSIFWPDHQDDVGQAVALLREYLKDPNVGPLVRQTQAFGTQNAMFQVMRLAGN